MNLSSVPSKIEYSRSLSMDYHRSTRLFVTTREGDHVTLSMDQQRHYAESSRRYTRADGSFVREFSVVAQTASRYSLVIQGHLNEGEMSAITRLARKLSPLARDFLNQGEGQKETTMASAIEKFRLSMQEDSSTRVEKTGNPGGDSQIRDLPALMSALLDSIFLAIVGGMRDSSGKVLDSLGSLPSSIPRPTGEKHDDMVQA